jgi:hypothetical protein
MYTNQDIVSLDNIGSGAAVELFNRESDNVTNMEVIK